ncbi:glycosyltransferase [Mucilaginibacter sp. FT3.2]|uniref:glycosyltransferase n=1 Tax=Mucilaginibacter sp. FT3.2 TaxID=2723090 RepID=UPI00161BA23E|nr:glycosyltransferase [Mucilaginibacter sp. FT3.2]MBB6232255.1 glycosyltransferase involved in cell wall biosynthesis [Mucilaginibacter sp. FT3.2]
MISIIISSADSRVLQEVRDNVAATIGVPYEIIAIDNSAGKQGICSVYNKGLLRAKYPILCFMHEDIQIKTINWGDVIIKKFKKNPDVGVMGVMGSSYKSMTPSGWSSLGIENIFYGNLIQHHKYSAEPPRHLYTNPYNEKLSQVACLDGVWLCTTKKVAREFMFDEVNFTGFHVYDLDFSLSVGQKYKLAVTYDILIEHFSEGRFDEKWMMDTLKLHEKWNNVLPINCDSLSIEEVIHSEKATFKHFIKRLSSLNLPLHHAHKMLRLNNRFLNLNTKLFFKLQYYIVLRYLSLK